MSIQARSCREGGARWQCSGGRARGVFNPRLLAATCQPRLPRVILITVLVTGDDYDLFGGCTLILDLDELTLRYAISKPVADDRREKDFRGWAEGDASAALALRAKEPIAHLHLNA